MRIRTYGDYNHREDVIEKGAKRLVVNKTRAVLLSADGIGSLLEEIEDALTNQEISPRSLAKYLTRSRLDRVTGV